MKKQLVELVIVGDKTGIQKGIGSVSFVVFHKLGFKQFEKQDAVNPADRQCKGYVEELFLPAVAVGVSLAQVVDPVFAVENGDCVFKYRRRVATRSAGAGDDALAPAAVLVDLFKPYYIEQLAVKFGV